MKRIMAYIGIAEVSAGIGLVLLTIGAGLVYLPFAFIVPGLLLLSVGIVGSR